MIPNLHSYEQLLFEHCQERQHAAAGLRRERDGLSRRFVAHRGGFLIKFCSSSKRLEVREKQVTYDQ